MLLFPLTAIGWVGLAASLLGVVLLWRHTAPLQSAAVLTVGLLLCALDPHWYVSFVRPICVLYADADAQIAYWARENTIMTTVPASMLPLVGGGILSLVSPLVRRRGLRRSAQVGLVLAVVMIAQTAWLLWATGLYFLY